MFVALVTMRVIVEKVMSLNDLSSFLMGVNFLLLSADIMQPPPHPSALVEEPRSDELLYMECIRMLSCCHQEEKLQLQIEHVVRRGLLRVHRDWLSFFVL